MSTPGAGALEQALACMGSPGLLPAARAAALPADVGIVLRLAAGDEDSLAIEASRTGLPAGRLHDAAVFYIQQVLFAQGGDSYRVLGVERTASATQLREHYRLLVRWLHPDRNRNGWEDVYLDRVHRAWQQLRSPERRRVHDVANVPSLRTPAPSSQSASSTRATVAARRKPSKKTPALLSIFGLALPVLVVLAFVLGLEPGMTDDSTVVHAASDSAATSSPRLSPERIVLLPEREPAIADEPASPGITPEPILSPSPVAAMSVASSPTDTIPASMATLPVEAAAVKSTTSKPATSAAAVLSASPAPVTTKQVASAASSSPQTAKAAVAEKPALATTTPTRSSDPVRPTPPSNAGRPAVATAAPQNPVMKVSGVAATAAHPPSEPTSSRTVSNASALPAAMPAADILAVAPRKAEVAQASRNDGKTKAASPRELSVASPVINDRVAFSFVQKFRRAYNEGNLEQLMALFARDIRLAGGKQQFADALRSQIKAGDRPRITLGRPDWHGNDRGLVIVVGYRAQRLDRVGQEARTSNGQVRFDLRQEDGELRIVQLQPEQF